MKRLRYYLPIYWPVWLLLGCFWLLIQLPFRWQLQLGKLLGLIIMKIAKQSRRVATINIKLCFPEFSQQQRDALLRNSFINLGIAFFETGMGFWASNRRLKKLIHMSGQQQTLDYLKKKRGVLLLGAHFTTIEIVGRACAMEYDFAVMYRPHKIAILNFILKSLLEKHYIAAVPRHDIRQMVKLLKAGHAVWYSGDVNPARKKSIFAPFFNIPAATAKAPMRLAEMTDCAVIPLYHYRKPDGTYQVELLPELTNFPSGDLEQDAIRINQIIESLVRKQPEQYLWQYMRFKTRPSGEKKIYKKDSPVLTNN